MLRPGFVVAFALACAGCDASKATASSSRPPNATRPDPAAKEPKDGRPLFIHAPELVATLELGTVTEIAESWVELVDEGTMNHCYAARLEITDIPAAGAKFTEVVKSLGHEVVTTSTAITVEEDGLLITLMLVATNQTLVNACWHRDTDPVEAFEDLIPREPPLAKGGEIASGAGGVEHVTLEWSHERGVALRLAGSIPAGKAEAVASWFRNNGYGEVAADAQPVEHDHGEGLTTLASVDGGTDPRWIIQLRHADGESPFR